MLSLSLRSRAPRTFQSASTLLLLSWMLLLTALPMAWPAPDWSALSRQDSFSRPAAPVASRDGLRLQHAVHQALFAAGGPQIQPHSGGPRWAWQLAAVRSPDLDPAAVRLGPVDPIAGDDGVIRYVRGGLIEQYVPHAASIEQQFILPQPLTNGADLEIRGTVRAEGRMQPIADGWAWIDARGRALTLGDVFVFDAAGTPLPALMEVRANATRIVVDGAALAQARYPVTVDPQIGAGDFPISAQGPTGDLNFTAFTPAIAYNSAANEYMIAWTGTLGPGEEDIYIQRLAADGTALETAGLSPDATTRGVRISVSRNNQVYDAYVPAIAYDSLNNQYLVVWRMDDPELGLIDNQYEIYGQLLAADGTPLEPADAGQIVPPDAFNDPVPNGAQLSNFRISFMNADSSSPNDAYDPAVAFSPASGSFLVVWWGDKATDGRNDIRGRFVSTTGELLGSADRLISNMGPNAINSAFGAYDPDLAYNPVNGEFLVVWSGANAIAPIGPSQQPDGEYEIYGQRIDAVTQQDRGTDFPISNMGPDESSVFYDAIAPAVAVGDDGRYFVVWQGNEEALLFDDGAGGTDYTPIYEAYGQLLDRDGNQIGPDDLRISTMGLVDSDAQFGLVNGPVYNSNPDRYSERTFGDPRSSVVTSYALSAAVDVAYDAASDEFVAVWASDHENQRVYVNKTEIFAQRIRASDGAEVGINDQQISTMGPSRDPSYDAHTPAIAYNPADDELLAIWAGNDDPLLYEIYGQRLAFAPPTVVNLNSVQGTGDGTLSAGEMTRSRITRLLVQFSIAVTTPNTAASYLLVNDGENGQFDTVACGAPAGDDTAIALVAIFDSATNTTTLYLNGGSSLPTDWYRVIVCGSGENALRNSDGDTLDGDADGVAGGDFIRDFAADRVAPLLDPLPDLTVETNNPAGTTVDFDLSDDLRDTIDPAPTVTCSPASGSFFNVGDTPVTCRAVDAAGNESSERSFSVSVIYRESPIITVPDLIVTEATGPNGSLVNFIVSAEDNIGPVTVTCVPASGDTFALGDTVVTCSASNSAGAAEERFTVTVQDTTAPQISDLSDQVVEATGPDGAAVTFGPTANDLVDGAVVVDCDAVSGATFPLGTTTVECTASDSRDNTAEGAFTVTVQDTTAPVLSGLNNLTVAAETSAGAVVTFAPTASDLVDGDVAVDCDAVSGAIFPIGTTTVECTASDSSSNTADGSFTVTVRDERVPTLVVPAALSIEATGPNGAPVTYETTASDSNGNLTPSCTPASGSIFAIGTTKVNCSVTGGNGISAEDSFSVIVRDTSAPVLSGMNDIIVTAQNDASATVTFAPTARDLVDGAVAVICAPASGSSFSVGVTTVNCTTSDSRGNTAQGSFTVTVNALVPPPAPSVFRLYLPMVVTQVQIPLASPTCETSNLSCNRPE